MRIFSLCLCVALASCGEGDGGTDFSTSAMGNFSIPAIGSGTDHGSVAASDMILCAHGDETMMLRCTVERTRDDRGLVLTLRHPDGAFRRLLVTMDGRDIVAADGADYAVSSTAVDDAIEIGIGTDRYRLPADISDEAS